MRWTVFVALGASIPLTISSVSGVAVAQDHDQSVQALLAEAGMAQSRGEFPKAAEAYRRAVALEPSMPELWANLGVMYHESGKHAEAIKSFQQAIRLNPSLFVPQLFMGLEYVQAHKAEAALPYLENAVRLNPKDLQAVRSLGEVQSVLGHDEKATELYWDVVQMAPNQGSTWFDLGTAYLRQLENDARLMTSSYGDSAYVKLRSAEVLAEEGNLIDAEEAYKAAIALPPPVPCSFAEFGITLLRQQKNCRRAKTIRARPSNGFSVRIGGSRYGDCQCCLGKSGGCAHRARIDCEHRSRLCPFEPSAVPWRCSDRTNRAIDRRCAYRSACRFFGRSR